MIAQWTAALGTAKLDLRRSVSRSSWDNRLGNQIKEKPYGDQDKEKNTWKIVLSHLIWSLSCDSLGSRVRPCWTAPTCMRLVRGWYKYWPWSHIIFSPGLGSMQLCNTSHVSCIVQPSAKLRLRCFTPEVAKIGAFKGKLRKKRKRTQANDDCCTSWGSSH